MVNSGKKKTISSLVLFYWLHSLVWKYRWLFPVQLTIHIIIHDSEIFESSMSVKHENTHRHTEFFAFKRTVIMAGDAIG